MGKIQEGLSLEGDRAASEVRRLCAKIADNAGKGHWWNAMASAAELVIVCQHGCRAEIARVVKNKAMPRSKTAAKNRTKTNKTSKPKKPKKTKRR
jgi:hypothetical protein